MSSLAKKPLLAGLAIAAILVSAPVFAETLSFKADLKGATEVPPADSPAKKLSWTVSYSGLTGEATAAHFHGPAVAGENAGPVVDISGAIESGSADLTDQQLADLQTGKWYLNVHSAKFPDGEIRGQVEKAQ